jgi:ParB-like chromosome segregation protein Spo0J
MTKEVPIEKLEPHPFNDEIYSSRGVADLASKIEMHGFKAEHRILITPEYEILSGHRRCNAAQQAGLETIPAKVVNVSSEHEKKMHILLANKYRTKNQAELIRETEAWEQLYKDPSSDVKIDKGESSRAKATEKTNMSEGNYHKGKKVKEKAEQGDEDAQEAWEELEDGDESVHGAFQKVKDTDEDDTTAQSRTIDPTEQHTELELTRVLEDGAGIYTSGEDTYLVPVDELP